MNIESRNIQLGKNGERFAVSIFEQIIGKRRIQRGWYNIKHQNWDNNYTYGTGVDIEVSEDNKPLIDIEVKNLKNQHRPYGTDFAVKEVVPRFYGSTAPIKLLFITFLCLLTEKARQLIEQAGIEIIEIGNWIVKATWKETFKKFMLNHYYELKSCLKLKPLSNRASKKRPIFSCSSTSSCLTSDCNNPLNMNKKHDINIECKLTKYIPINNNNSNEQENAKIT
jgi:hypothetical protein